MCSGWMGISCFASHLRAHIDTQVGFYASSFFRLFGFPVSQKTFMTLTHMYKYSTTNYLKSLLCQKHNWIENKTLTVASSWPMVMDWTPQSPDLNIIEAVRVILREHPMKSFDYPSRSLENHSWGTLKEMTESESCSVCQLPQRVQAVKKNKGVHTKYSLSNSQ